MRRFLAVTVAVVAGLLMAAPTGAAASTTSKEGFYIRGAGFGHGIGMSQYGALGFAQHGYTYTSILAHYYTGTTLATINPNRVITVLLADGAATFRGAVTANGKALKPTTTYGVIQSGGKLELISGGRNMGKFAAPLTVAGKGGVLDLLQHGTYRGVFVFRPSGNGVQTVNALGIEDYVRGVIGAEMPASWPAAALEAQAVAARTYALATGPVNPNYDVYSDTRSQEYGGVSAETPSTDAAEAATSGQVVDYAGSPAVTYFFSSSGGYTESIQNVWLGVTPEAWLRGVPDPYDDAGGNPYYRWQVNLSVGGASAKLGELVAGSLKGIKILEHGVSPRIVKAAVIGTKGTSDVTGAELQQLFGTMSTYMAFTTITAKGTVSSSGGATSATPYTAPSSTGSGSGGSSSGGSGVGAVARVARAARATEGQQLARVPWLEVTGTIYPAGAAAGWSSQQRVGRRWMRIASGRRQHGGSYAIRRTGRPARYRDRVRRDRRSHHHASPRRCPRRCWSSTGRS